MVEMTPTHKQTSCASTQPGTAHSSSNRRSLKISNKTKGIKKTLKHNKLIKTKQNKAKKEASSQPNTA